MGITDPAISFIGNELRSFACTTERTGTAKYSGLPAWRKPFPKKGTCLKIYLMNYIFVVLTVTFLIALWHPRFLHQELQRLPLHREARRSASRQPSWRRALGTELHQPRQLPGASACRPRAEQLFLEVKELQLVSWWLTTRVYEHSVSPDLK